MNNIYIKKPFLTDAEKRVQNWLLRRRLTKVQPPISEQEPIRDAEKKLST
jgi:hypothetical protein